VYTIQEISACVLYAANLCEPQEIENGEVICSTESLIASTDCEFICDDEFDVFPPDLSINTCMNNSQWSSEPPCCARKLFQI